MEHPVCRTDVFAPLDVDRHNVPEPDHFRSSNFGHQLSKEGNFPLNSTQQEELRWIETIL
jgi:hypothetical protein